MTAPFAIQRLALRGMTTFQCLGEHCEDTCCRGWTIHVDEGHYKKLKRAFDHSDEERALFDQWIERNRSPGRQRHSFAVLQQHGDGTCMFLDEKQWCGLQQRLGEPMLPDVCSAYPRSIGQNGRRIELTGSLSCPEVARKVLLAEDATDLVESPIEPFGRGVVMRKAEGKTPWVSHLDELRVAMFRLAGRGDFPVRSRLFFMAWFAHQTSDFLRHGAVEEWDEERLQSELDAVDRPSVQEELHAQLRASDAAGPLPVLVIARTLAARLAQPGGAAFRTLVWTVLGSYASEPGSGVAAHPDGLRLTLDAGLLWQAFLRRKDAAVPLAEAVDLYLQNYCKQFWLRDWYVFSPSFLVHLQNLLVRVAIVRFLLLSHPSLAAIAACPDPAERQRLLDALAVEVFYTFSRAVEHNDGFLSMVSAALAAELPGIGHSLALILL